MLCVCVEEVNFTKMVLFSDRDDIMQLCDSLSSWPYLVLT